MRVCDLLGGVQIPFGPSGTRKSPELLLALERPVVQKVSFILMQDGSRFPCGVSLRRIRDLPEKDAFNSVGLPG